VALLDSRLRGNDGARFLSILQHRTLRRPGLAEIPHFCKPKITKNLQKIFAEPVDNLVLRG